MALMRETPYNPRHARKETKRMFKLTQFLVRGALLMAALYAILWLAEALGDLAVTLFPW